MQHTDDGKVVKNKHSKDPTPLRMAMDKQMYNCIIFGTLFECQAELF
jgi:hypothetical protein